MNITKQTSKGTVEISVSGSTATVSLNGKVIGTSGTISSITPIEKNGVRYVATICGVALTAEERDQVKAALAAIPTETSNTRKNGIWSHCFTAEVNRAGDISKFPTR